MSKAGVLCSSYLLKGEGGQSCTDQGAGRLAAGVGVAMGVAEVAILVLMVAWKCEGVQQCGGEVQEVLEGAARCTPR